MVAAASFAISSGEAASPFSTEQKATRHSPILCGFPASAIGSGSLTAGSSAVY